MVVGVAINGENVWVAGFGYSDIENNVPCKPDTVMRIASISKSLTMAAVGKLIEEGKLNISKPIQQYVPNFPPKKFDGEEVEITTEMLLSHMSGLRHYSKNVDNRTDHEFLEFYSMKQYKDVSEALTMFKDDALVHKPGTKYLYSTHGWTLVSAVVEGASGDNFVKHMRNMFLKLGMKSTFDESAEKIIYNRSRHYVRDEKGRLLNVPYVDLSYKWAGGGFVSNIPDLLKFGNVMLYSSQCESNESLKGYLRKETVEMMWSPKTQTSEKKPDSWYGMGWGVYPKIETVGCGSTRDFQVLHTGGAVGASSVLYICPVDSSVSQSPHGIVVAVITNLQSVQLSELARNIANEFKYTSL